MDEAPIYDKTIHIFRKNLRYFRGTNVYVCKPCIGFGPVLEKNLNGDTLQYFIII